MIKAVYNAPQCDQKANYKNVNLCFTGTVLLARKRSNDVRAKRRPRLEEMRWRVFGAAVTSAGLLADTEGSVRQRRCQPTSDPVCSVSGNRDPDVLGLFLKYDFYFFFPFQFL